MINVWNKGQLTKTYIILEHFYRHKGLFANQVVFSKNDSDALNKLFESGYVRRIKQINPSTMRKSYFYIITKKGKEAFIEAHRKWQKDIKPTFIEIESPLKKQNFSDNR